MAIPNLADLPIPKPPCARDDSVGCLLNRVVWWAEQSTRRSKMRPLDLLLLAAAHWCVRRGMGASTLFNRIAGLYALAERLGR